MKPTTIYLRTTAFCNNLYIQLKPEENDCVKPYENIIIKYENQEIKIPIEKLFNKLKEMFEEGK